MLRLISISIFLSVTLFAGQAKELSFEEELMQAEREGVAAAEKFDGEVFRPAPALAGESRNALAEEIIAIETTAGREAPIVLPRSDCESDRARSGRMFLLFEKNGVEACMSVGASIPKFLNEFELVEWGPGDSYSSSVCGCKMLVVSVNTGQ